MVKQEISTGLEEIQNKLLKNMWDWKSSRETKGIIFTSSTIRPVAKQGKKWDYSPRSSR